MIPIVSSEQTVNERNYLYIFLGALSVYIAGTLLVEFTLGEAWLCAFFGFDKTPHRFLDLTNLMWGAASIADGYNPLYENPHDLYARKMNQPQFVQVLVSMFRLDVFSVYQVASVMIGVFMVSLAGMFKFLDRWSALLLGLALFSPPVALAINRCNHDILVFAIIVLGLRLNRGGLAFFSCALLASFIKLFPVFVITYFLKYAWKKWLLLSFAFGGAFILYICLNWQDLSQIFQSTQKSYVHSYGAKVYTTMWISSDDPIFSKFSLIPVFAILGTLSVALFSSYGVKGWQLEGREAYLDAFRVGAGVYVGSYIIGNNWDYRLIYLMLMIPQLVSWAIYQKIWAARFTLVVVFFSLFVTFAKFTQVQFFIDELVNWLLFGLLFMLLVRSVPSDIYARLGLVKSSAE